MAERWITGDLHPAAFRRRLRSRDIAYGGFLYIGLLLTGGFVWNWIPTGIWLYWWGGRLLTFPGLMLTVPAGAVAFAFTVAARHERALWLMTALVAATPIILWLGGSGRSWGEAAAAAFFVALAAANTALPVRWFTCRRRACEAEFEAT
jgi:hypothetical protein